MGWLTRFWEWLKGLLTPALAGPAVSIRFTATGGVIVSLGGKCMLMLRDDQKVGLSIQPLDAKGRSARVDGVPVWNTSDETLGTLTVAADGFSAEFVAQQVGTVQVSVTVDADLGAGVRALSGTLDIQIEPGEAVSIGIVAGVPVAQ